MYILLLPYFLYTYLKILHGMHMLQQNFYNEDNRYLHWILKNLNKSLITPDLFGLFLIILPIFKNDLIIYIGLFIFYSIHSPVKSVYKNFNATFGKEFYILLVLSDGEFTANEWLQIFDNQS